MGTIEQRDHVPRTEGPEPTGKPPRLVSLDQFRGYTVVAMDVVNFLGGFAVSPYLLKHHNTFCSYADTIMPHFMFAVGFSFRLSFGRRALRQGTGAAYLRVVQRLLGLLLVALFVFQFDDRLLPTYWFDLASRQAWNEIWRPFQRNWTQTLFQIALATLWIVPVIRLRARWRLLYLLASALIFLLLNHLFYFHWMYAPPVNGHTGGPLGFLAWSVPTLAGTLTCDAITSAPGRARLARLFASAFLLMTFAWLLSCGTRFYDVPADQVAREEGEVGKQPAVGVSEALSRWWTRLARGEWSALLDGASFESLPGIADHPVVPDSEACARWRAKWAHGEWSELLAEPPFVPPPEPRLRKWNYWMMSVKAGTLSFMTFNAGFSMFVYLLFYVACDVYGWRLGVFRTFGRNALAGYLLQWPIVATFKDLVERTSERWAPGLGWPADAIGRNAPAVFVGVAFVLCIFFNWLVLRWMEKKGIFFTV